MADRSSFLFRTTLGPFLLSGFAVIVLFLASHRSPVTGQSDDSVVEDEFVELAPYMGQLERLTQKLGLSIKHSNHGLAEFYLYESLEAFLDIKKEVPEYRGHAIALLVERLSEPHYKLLEEAIKKDKAAGDKSNTHATAAFKGVINSCNQCHAVTQHGFIKITETSEVNPFNQDFRP